MAWTPLLALSCGPLAQWSMTGSVTITGDGRAVNARAPIASRGGNARMHDPRDSEPSATAPWLDCWPDPPAADWGATLTTIHLWTQIVGKIRLALAPP